MKKFYFFLVGTLLLLTNQTIAQCPTGATPITGSDMTFTSGNYCLSSGTFTGNVSGMKSGVTIYIASGASFKPQNINGGDPSCTIKVYGELVMNNFNVGSGFTLENYKTTTFASVVTFSSNAQIYNYANGVMTFGSSINFNGSNNKIYNYDQAIMTFANSFQLKNGNYIENSGDMKMAFSTDFNLENGSTFINKKTVRLNGSFNPAGVVVNDGLLVAQNVININSGASVTNNCKFVSVKGFQNNANFFNNGLVWITSTNDAESHVQNNGGATITTGSKSVFRGIQFTNGGTINGAGKFHFTGITRQQGSFNGSSAAAPIVFYDVTQSVGLIFDFPTANQQYTNTVRQSFTPADTSSFDCSTTVLPLQLAGFDAQAVQNKSILLTWQSQNETNLKSFSIERNDKPTASGWQLVGTVTAQGNSTTLRNYQLTDKAPLSGTSYYRMRATDVDGKETISIVRMVNLSGKGNLQVYPTLVPQGGVVKVLSTEALCYQLLDMSGKVLQTGTFTNGASVLTLNVSSGSYMIETVNDSNLRQHSKIIVQ